MDSLPKLFTKTKVLYQSKLLIIYDLKNVYYILIKIKMNKMIKYLYMQTQCQHVEFDVDK